jgi:hypothetical protein
MMELSCWIGNFHYLRFGSLWRRVLYLDGNDDLHFAQENIASTNSFTMSRTQRIHQNCGLNHWQPSRADRLYSLVFNFSLFTTAFSLCIFVLIPRNGSIANSPYRDIRHSSITCNPSFVLIQQIFVNALYEYSSFLYTSHVLSSPAHTRRN